MLLIRSGHGQLEKARLLPKLPPRLRRQRRHWSRAHENRHCANEVLRIRTGLTSLVDSIKFRAPSRDRQKLVFRQSSLSASGEIHRRFPYWLRLEWALRRKGSIVEHPNKSARQLNSSAHKNDAAKGQWHKLDQPFRKIAASHLRRNLPN